MMPHRTVKVLKLQSNLMPWQILLSIRTARGSAQGYSVLARKGNSIWKQWKQFVLLVAHTLSLKTFDLRTSFILSSQLPVYSDFSWCDMCNMFWVLKVLMKDIVTPVPQEEVKAVIHRCLEQAALVNYQRLSEYAKLEGKLLLPHINTFKVQQGYSVLKYKIFDHDKIFRQRWDLFIFFKLS